jgi:hypothetical protein
MGSNWSCDGGCKEQAKSWEDWARYTREANADPYLKTVGKPDCTKLLLASAARVRTGIYGKGKQVGHQSVEKALCHVAQTLQLAGYDDLPQDLWLQGARAAVSAHLKELQR